MEHVTVIYFNLQNETERRFGLVFKNNKLYDKQYHNRDNLGVHLMKKTAEIYGVDVVQFVVLNHYSIERFCKETGIKMRNINNKKESHWEYSYPCFLSTYISYFKTKGVSYFVVNNI